MGAERTELMYANNKKRKPKSIIVLSSHTPSLLWFRLELMREIQERGYEVVAAGNESADIWGDRFEAEGISYRQIIVSRNGTNPLNDIQTIKSIKKLFRTIHPYRVFAFQAKTVIYGGVAAKGEKIEGFYPLIAGLGSVFLASGVKSLLLRGVLIAEYTMALKNARSIFFQNCDDLDTFKKCGMISGNHETIIIPGSGVNVQKFTTMPLPERFGTLLIARLIRDKGIIEYLEACRILVKKYPDSRCMLVGPFDSNPTALTMDQLQPYIDDGIVEYYGEQTDVRPFIEQCSVYVLPSYREGTPKTVLEAMACSRAIITTDTVGCRETVRDGINGYLVPTRDFRLLASKMIYLHDNHEEVIRMGKESRVMAEKIFDVRKVNDIILRTMGV